MKLVEINEFNMAAALKLKVHEHQQKFVASSAGILARAYAFRHHRSKAFLLNVDETYVGLVMIRDLNEAPSCYDLQQLMIDAEHQGKGYGHQAMKLIIETLREEGQFDHIEVCVEKEDEPAVRLYEKCGFVDTLYVDDSRPSALNMRYSL